MISTLPWFKVEARSVYEKKNFDRTISGKTKLGNPISIARVYNTISVDVDNTTDFIIRAANNHDALVAALEHMLTHEYWDQDYTYVSSVLAKAKAGEE